jgi:hypothetical protein
MAGNPHPVYRDGVNVAKSAARSYTLLRLATADELRALDGSTFWYAYIQELGADFVRSTTDTTSPDDNETVIIDANGARWIRLSLELVLSQTPIAGGSDKSVFYNNNGKLGEYAVSGTGKVVMTNSPKFEGNSNSPGATLNTEAYIELINGNTGAQYRGAELRFGVETGVPMFMWKSELLSGPSPYFGELNLYGRTSGGSLDRVLRISHLGTIYSGQDNSEVSGPFNFGAYNSVGFQNFIGYTETKNATSGEACISGYFVAAANDIADQHGAWGVYAEGRAENSQVTVGAEIDVQVISTEARTISPNYIFGVPGYSGPQAVAIWSQPNGSKFVPSYNASAFMCTVFGDYNDNPKWKRGWVVQKDAIVSVDGHIEAISLPASNEIAWYSNDDNHVARLYSDGQNTLFNSQNLTQLIANNSAVAVSLGYGATGDRDVRIYFGASNAYGGGDLEILRGGGANEHAQFINRGTGAMVFSPNANSALILFSGGAVKLPGYTAGALITDADGDVTAGTLPVAYGGTGAFSFTSNAILTGNGTSALNATGWEISLSVMSIPSTGQFSFGGGAVTLTHNTSLNGLACSGNISAGVFQATIDFRIGNDILLAGRKTGWAQATGTATRTAFDTTTVTTPQLAERVKALIDDLHEASGGNLRLLSA